MYVSVRFTDGSSSGRSFHPAEPLIDHPALERYARTSAGSKILRYLPSGWGSAPADAPAAKSAPARSMPAPPPEPAARSGSGAGPAPAVSSDAADVGALLRSFGLGQYEAAFDDAGYDDLDFLAKFAQDEKARLI